MNVDARTRAVIRAYFESINGEDWDRLATLFHDDAELHAPGTAPRRGGAAVASYYHDALRPYPVHRDEPTREIYAGETVTVEIHFDGELPNGSAMAFDAVDVFDFRDGRIARLSSWYDSNRVIGALIDAAAAGGDDADARAGLDRLTPARRRSAFRRVRRGAAFRLGAGRWSALDPARRGEAIVGRAVLLDLPPGTPVGAYALDAAVARQGVAPGPGDLLLVRTGGAADGSSPLAAWVERHALAGVATDGPSLDAGAQVAAGVGWELDELAADGTARGVWDGLLVSLPAGDPPAANAVVFR